MMDTPRQAATLAAALAVAATLGVTGCGGATALDDPTATTADSAGPERAAEDGDARPRGGDGGSDGAQTDGDAGTAGGGTFDVELEDCTDGIDNNANGRLDCADATCASDPACAANGGTGGVGGGENGGADPNGLVGHWTFDEGSGDIAHDSSSNALHGAVRGGQWVEGVSGTALDSAGTMVVDVADGPVLQLTESFTLEAWVRAMAGMHSAHGMIIFRGDSRPGLDAYVLSMEPGDQIQLFIQNSSDAYAAVTAPMPTDRFVFVAATLDHLTGSLKLYLDGVLVGETTTDIRPLGPLDQTARPGVGFGGHANRSAGNYGLYGTIDEIRIFSVAHSADQIAARYAQLANP
jgi:hypothetical protein